MNDAHGAHGGGPADSRPRLGELLVERGLLSREHLDLALAEQSATGLALGTILVRDGLVPARTVAMALADQQGAPLKTEHGFATGTRSALGADVVPLRPPPVSDESHVPPPPPAALPPTPQPADPSAELEARFAAIESRAQELAASLAASQHDLEAERAATTELRAHIAELEERVASYRADLATLPERRVYSTERHLLFAPGPHGYELIERSGAAPEIGGVVELSGYRMFRVLRLGPAPFPGAFEACAFLDALPPADHEE